MIKFITIGLLGIMVSLVGNVDAFAQENPFTNLTGPESAPVQSKSPKPKAKPDSGIRVNGTICRRAVKHVPRDDVTYKAGVDAYGNPVTPADVPGSNFQFDIPDEISFNLDFNPLKYAGNSNLEILFPDASASLGTIKYSIGSGKLTYNGKPLTDDQASAIAAACREYARKHGY